MPSPRWMSTALYLAGAYNLLWGSWVVFFPTSSFAACGQLLPGKPLEYPQLWQCIGMIVGVYGVGYAAAAADPGRHWPVVLVGFLGKVFGPIGWVYGLANGNANPSAFWVHLTNDLVWIVPFALILRHAATRPEPKS